MLSVFLPYAPKKPAVVKKLLIHHIYIRKY